MILFYLLPWQLAFLLVDVNLARIAAKSGDDGSDDVVFGAGGHEPLYLCYFIFGRNLIKLDVI